MNKIEEKQLDLACKAKFLKQVFNLQKTMSNETKLQLFTDRIELLNVDPANVCIIQQIIPITSIEEYRATENLDIGIALDKITFILKTISKEDMLRIKLFELENKISLKVGIFEHNLNILDVAGMPTPKIPNFVLPGEFIIDTKTFYDFLTQAEKVSDYIQISIDKEGIILTANGDIDTVKISIEKSLLQLHIADNMYKSNFSVDYLKSTIQQIKPMFDKIHLYLGNDMPLKITAKSQSELLLLLAPRIETD